MLQQGKRDANVRFIFNSRLSDLEQSFNMVTPGGAHVPKLTNFTVCPSLSPAGPGTIQSPPIRYFCRYT